GRHLHRADGQTRRGGSHQQNGQDDERDGESGRARPPVALLPASHGPLGVCFGDGGRHAKLLGWIPRAKSSTAYADRTPTRVAVSGRTTNRLFLMAGTSLRAGCESRYFFFCSTLPAPA